MTGCTTEHVNGLGITPHEENDVVNEVLDKITAFESSLRVGHDETLLGSKIGGV